MNALPDSSDGRSDNWLEDTRTELYHRMDALEEAQRDVDARLDKLEKNVEQSVASVQSCIDNLLNCLNKEGKNNMAPFPPVKIKKEPEDPEEDVKIPPLSLAARVGDLVAVRELLSTGALAVEQDGRGESILEVAAAAGHSEIVQLLLHHGYNFTQSEEPSAVASKHLEDALLVAKTSAVAKILLEKVGPSVAVAAMHRAAQEGRVTVLHELLSSEVAADEVDESGWSALHLAAGAGQVDCMKVLLEFRARNGYVGGPNLQTPLHLAAEKGHAQCIDLLLLSGPHGINLRDRHGYTALFYAVAGTFVECVRALLSHGAKATLANIKGETPLHKAACLTPSERNNDEDAPTAAAHRKEILKMLLDVGAKPYVRCEDGRTAFDQDGCDALNEVVK